MFKTQEHNPAAAPDLERIKVIKAKIHSLESDLAKLTAEFEKATNEKLRCQQEAELTGKTIDLANRLVGGLASENVRWAEAINEYRGCNLSVISKKRQRIKPLRNRDRNG
jgi:dynein heavy chain